MFSLTDEAKEVLKNLKAPFGVISVAGMYRTGKSYLINKLFLDERNGFNVGNTVNPCTKGLWMWSNVVKCKSDGKIIDCLVIDTEGFGAFDEDVNHDYKIFLLAILLSSTFIYNSVGTIDENALNSLSFVLNLSKKMAGNEIVFPELVWILRDFSLQLQNEYGQQISSNDYLELVLNSSSDTQNKTSDEAKNKIRSTIKSFFQKRRCFTLIRPTIDEYKIQELKDEDLRPDFMEQIINLKNSVLGNVKPKKFSNNDLEGQALINMIEGFVQQINQGAVPQVKDLFTNICISEACKGHDLSLELYENLFLEVIKNKGENNKEGISSNLKSIINNCKSITNYNPIFLSLEKELLNKQTTKNMTLDDFSTHHSKFKSLSIDLFNIITSFSVEESNGDQTKFKHKEVQEIFYKFLKELKSKRSHLKEIVEEDARSSIIKILHQKYNNIELRLQQEIFHESEEDINISSITETSKKKLLDKNYENLFASLDKIGANLSNNFPDYSFTKELFNDFKANILSLVLSILKTKNESDIELIKQEKTRILETISNEKNEIEVKFKLSTAKKDNQIAELQNILNEVKRDLSEKHNEHANYGKDSLNKIQSLTEQLNSTKDEMNKKIESLKMKLQEANDKAQEAERSKITISSECEKEKALLTQTIEHQNKQLEEYKKNDKDANRDLISHLKEQQTALKDQKEKYEKLITELNSKISILNEKLIDTESGSKYNLENLNDLEKKIKHLEDERIIEKEVLEARLKEAFNNLDSEKKANHLKIKELKEEHNTAFENIRKTLSYEIEKLNDEVTKQKENNQSISNENMKFKQKLELEELNSKDLSEQLKQFKESQENLLQKFHFNSSESSSKEMEIKIKELQKFFEEEKQTIKEGYEKQIHLLNIKFEKLNELFNSEMKRTELENSDLIKEKEQLKEDLSNQVQISKMLERKIKQIENDNEAHLETITEQFQRDKIELEEKIETIKKESMKEMEEFNITSEGHVKNIKQLFEIEKTKLEDKIKSEKSSAERKLKNTINDWETKYNDMEIELKNEIDLLTQEIHLIKEEFNIYANKAEKEVDLLKQTKEALEGLCQASKEALVKNQLQFKQSYEALVESSSKERNDLVRRIEDLNYEFLNTDKQLTTTTIKKEQLEKEILELTRQLEATRIDLENERKDTQINMRKMSDKLNDISEEFTIKKLEFNRENALLKQQIEFLNRKNEELKESIDLNQNRYEEKLLSLRIVIEKEFSENTNKLIREKTNLEEKLNSTNKELRDIEQTFLKQSSIHEKEKAELSEKLKLEYLNSSSNIEAKYKRQIAELQDSHKTMYLEMNDSYKQLQLQLNALNFQSELNNMKDNHPGSLTSKVQELFDLKENLQYELDQVKNEKERKIYELKEMQEREISQYIQRSDILEKSLKELDLSRNKILFEFDKVLIERNSLAAKLGVNVIKIDLNQISAIRDLNLSRRVDSNNKIGNISSNNLNTSNLRGRDTNTSYVKENVRESVSPIFQDRGEKSIIYTGVNNIRRSFIPKNQNDQQQQSFHQPYSKSNNFNNQNQNQIVNSNVPNIQTQSPNYNQNTNNYNYKVNQSLNMQNVRQQPNYQNNNQQYLNNQLNSQNIQNHVVTNNTTYNKGQNNVNYNYNYNPKISNQTNINNRIDSRQKNYNNNLDSSQYSRGNFTNNFNMNTNNFNPDFSNIEPHDFQLDDDKVLDSSFTSTNSIRLDLNTVNSNVFNMKGNIPKK